MKHKVFFWLLLKDRINTRDILQRKDGTGVSHLGPLYFAEIRKFDAFNPAMQLCKGMLGINWSDLCLHKTNVRNIQKN
jgi:hypothetical protein